MTTFDPSAWKAAGEAVRSHAHTFYRSAHGLITAHPSSTGASPIDAAAHVGDAYAQGEWHNIMADAYKSLSSTGSSMVATGEDYEATEEQAAYQRFWM
ncbi:hypothetical protein [uncultured Tessaracoccus sp.]|uniref:hypothetical protein n=1 Tax=uncultured Tessaracoccus sp. TaxID=905023 RepID=UPI0025F77E0F|nr:hypothetical protein [uncultured Tessaracoccus sp.]